VRDRNRPRKVGEKDEARLQERDQEQLAVGVVAGDLRAELGNASVQLLRAEEDFPDLGVEVSYDARSSR
jgi:hypothetical protein